MVYHFSHPFSDIELLLSLGTAWLGRDICTLVDTRGAQFNQLQRLIDCIPLIDSGEWHHYGHDNITQMVTLCI